jgi:hypothetical protein
VIRSFIAIVTVLVLAPMFAHANNGASSLNGGGAALRVFVHGRVAGGSVHDGLHNFRVRVFSKDGGLIHEEELQSDVRGNVYDLMLGSTRPLMISIHREMPIRVSIDGGAEMTNVEPLTALSSGLESGLVSELRKKEDNGFAAILSTQIAQQSADRITRYRSGLASRMHSAIAMLIPFEPATGLELEMTVAPPAQNMPQDPYQLAKYGRINVEYKNLATIDGNRVGFAAQAMHVAHHLLLYSAGVSTDINNDGMFTMTAGFTHYQTGNKRSEPFVDAPFMRFKFRSSPDNIFAYSELETTMHERAYISAMVGLGMMVTPGVRFVAGYQHTEFVMPTEQMVQQVNGLQGTFMWGVR